MTRCFESSSRVWRSSSVNVMNILTRVNLDVRLFSAWSAVAWLLLPALSNFKASNFSIWSFNAFQSASPFSEDFPSWCFGMKWRSLFNLVFISFSIGGSCEQHSMSKFPFPSLDESVMVSFFKASNWDRNSEFWSSRRLMVAASEVLWSLTVTLDVFGSFCFFFFGGPIFIKGSETIAVLLVTEPGDIDLFLFCCCTDAKADSGSDLGCSSFRGDFCGTSISWKLRFSTVASFFLSATRRIRSS